MPRLAIGCSFLDLLSHSLLVNSPHSSRPDFSSEGTEPVVVGCLQSNCHSECALSKISKQQEAQIYVRVERRSHPGNSSGSRAEIDISPPQILDAAPDKQGRCIPCCNVLSSLGRAHNPNPTHPSYANRE